jgi:hypothetical protein
MNSLIGFADTLISILRGTTEVREALRLFADPGPSTGGRRKVCRCFFTIINIVPLESHSRVIATNSTGSIPYHTIRSNNTLTVSESWANEYVGFIPSVSVDHARPSRYSKIVLVIADAFGFAIVPSSFVLCPTD